MSARTLRKKAIPETPQQKATPRTISSHARQRTPQSTDQTINQPTNRRRQIKSSTTTTSTNDTDVGYCDFEWVELFPKGIVFEGNHFVFILEDGEQKSFLPLRFPVQSADLLGVPNLKSLWKKSLTTLNQELFKLWDVQLQRCVFLKHSLGKHHVKLYYKKQGEQHTFEHTLDKVLGLVLEAELPFFATKSYIQECQVSDQKNEIFLVNQKWTEGRQRYLM